MNHLQERMFRWVDSLSIETLVELSKTQREALTAIKLNHATKNGMEVCDGACQVESEA